MDPATPEPLRVEVLQQLLTMMLVATCLLVSTVASFAAIVTAGMDAESRGLWPYGWWIALPVFTLAPLVQFTLTLWLSGLIYLVGVLLAGMAAFRRRAGPFWEPYGNLYRRAASSQGCAPTKECTPRCLRVATGRRGLFGDPV